MRAFFDTSALIPIFDEDYPHHLLSVAILFISSLSERLSTIALTNEEYVEALTTSAAISIIGGSIYDAMLARCALKSGAEIIYTWNTKYYAQCGAELVKRLSTP